MNKTSIEWCRTYRADGSFTEGHSVNPIRFRPRGSQRTTTMCQKVSPGCVHCYAEGMTRRFWPKDASGPFPGYTALGITTGEFVLDEKALLSVLRQKKPTRLFWGDMTDLFQESVPDAFLDRCFAVAALTPHITHIFLTKRADRMQQYVTLKRPNKMSDDACFDTPWYVWREANLVQAKLPLGSTMCPIGWDLDRDEKAFKGWPLPNVQLGVSVESNKHRDRIAHLRKTPAAVRFLSCEPLIAPLSLRWLCGWNEAHPRHLFPEPSTEGKVITDELDGLRELDWVIVGGESGRGARPMHPDWARSLRDECLAAGVPFFFKQWGEHLPSMQDGNPDLAPQELNCSDQPARVGKKAAGRLLDGREWNEMPGVRA